LENARAIGRVVLRQDRATERNNCTAVIEGAAAITF
jgi:hypothetical protein